MGSKRGGGCGILPHVYIFPAYILHQILQIPITGIRRNHGITLPGAIPVAPFDHDVFNGQAGGFIGPESAPKTNL